MTASSRFLKVGLLKFLALTLIETKQSAFVKITKSMQSLSVMLQLNRRVIITERIFRTESFNSGCSQKIWFAVLNATYFKATGNINLICKRFY